MGDNVHYYGGYSPTLEREMREAMGSTCMTVFSVIGNHDQDGRQLYRQKWEDSWGPTDYSFDRGGEHFVCFNNVMFARKKGYFQPGELSDAQMTLKGIGPTYTDKISRHGLRVGDILAPDFKERFEKLKARHIQLLSDLHFECDPDKDEAEWMSAIEFLKGFNLIDCEYFVNKWLEDKPMLAEGAQGSMLDIDYGSYPFVTSSSTTVGGVCTGLGVAPSKIGHVYGIFKAYCTRVGSGPFPTELFDETGEIIRQVGHEFGAVTGRPRRCGWLDLVALKYTVMIDGVTDLIMMKSDCLDDFETIKVCTSYKVDGVETDQVPFDIAAQIEPVYTEFPGWKKDLTGIRKESGLPQEFKNYIKFMEDYLGVPISIISLGPDREATIER